MTTEKQPKATDAIKKKADDLRKTLAKLDQLTGQSFTVARRADVAKFFGVSVQAVDKWLGAGMPGKRNAYDLHAIVVWLRSEGPWRPASANNHGLAEDLTSEGTESEWSEEYRKWKARIAELEYQQRVGQLMDTGRASRIWGEAVMPLVRGFAERVIKAHGNGTAQDWDDTCRQIEEAVIRELRRPDQGHGTELLDSASRGEVPSPDPPITD